MRPACIPPVVAYILPTVTNVPPVATNVLPTGTNVPPMMTNVPPTVTNVPPMAPNVPPGRNLPEVTLGTLFHGYFHVLREVP